MMAPMMEPDIPTAAPDPAPQVAVAANGGRPQIATGLPLLSLAALGVVFGDIGTSPLPSPCSGRCRW
jgi:hypothetical protein